MFLADYTTLGLGGPARDLRLRARTEADADRRGRGPPTRRGEPVLLIGGGSNLVISDAGFPGTVIHVNTRGLRYAAAGDGGRVDVTVAAGEDWDDVVAATVAEGLAGLESPVRHPRPRGRDPDPERRRLRPRGGRGHHPGAGVRPAGRPDPIVPNECCTFAYRTSLFKSGRPESLVSWPGGAVGGREPAGQPRYVVLDVTFRLAQAAAVRAGEVRRAGGRARRRRWGSRRASARSAPPCSRSAPARAWCSTPATRTPAAPAPSSPTR